MSENTDKGCCFCGGKDGKLEKTHTGVMVHRLCHDEHSQGTGLAGSLPSLDNSNEAGILVAIAKWIDEAVASDASLPQVKDSEFFPNIEDAAGLAKFLRWKAGQITHLSYIQLYRAVNGWQTMLMRWDDEGFYDVFTTGMGPYGHSKKGYDMACAEGKSWGEDEGLEFRAIGFEPLKPDEPSNIVECLTKLCAEQGHELTVVNLK